MVMMVFIACNNKNEKTTVHDVALNKLEQSIPSVTDTSMAVKYEEQTNAAESESAPSPPPKQQPGNPDQPKEKQAPLQTPTAKPDWIKKIIKNASLNIEVEQYNSFNKKVQQAAAQFGGYIADEQQNETEYKIENTLTLKVPVDQFQEAVDFLTTGDGKINEKKITSEDVTSQNVDTKSRLEAKRAARMRYLDFLKQAKNMEEILQVQSEIDDIQEEIESAAGRINYLSNASAMSTIHLAYYQVLNATAKDADNPGFFKEIKNAFVSGWKGIGDVFVGLMYVWPLIVLITFGVWLLKRYSTNKKKVETVKS
jgi:Domain of unknown function (DUF4349)